MLSYFSGTKNKRSEYGNCPANATRLSWNGPSMEYPLRNIQVNRQKKKEGMKTQNILADSSNVRLLNGKICLASNNRTKHYPEKITRQINVFRSAP
ncbi:MAG: hypothetical protein J7L95_00110 [Prolixibacteraceae bacterium]|nr:hypothetical protein [Prolixibacteraceae bacterium]